MYHAKSGNPGLERERRRQFIAKKKTPDGHKNVFLKRFVSASISSSRHSVPAF
jgi:hypothetical protein